MTVEEAKQILNKRRELVNRIDKLLKKGEITDPMVVFKLQRKRIEGFDLQAEAELLVREADKAFYQQWVDEVIEQPGSWSFQLFQSDIQERIKLVQQALNMRERQVLGSVYGDTPHTMRQVFRYVDEAEWQAQFPTDPAAPYRLFQYKMYLTDELIQLLRGYGRQIEVIEPECLREEV